MYYHGPTKLSSYCCKSLSKANCELFILNEDLTNLLSGKNVKRRERHANSNALRRGYCECSEGKMHKLSSH